MRGKEDKARENTREGGLLLVVSNIFHIGGRGEKLKGGKEKGGGIWDCVSVLQLFCAYRLEDFHRGHLLLGILGSGARKP
jgi:hypothetical protein